MKTVYLAGPITGLTYEEGQDWRAMMVKAFRASGVLALSPLRGKQYLKDVGRLEDQYHGIHALSEPAGIVTRDRNDCQKSDVVIANFLGAERVSIGTVMECAWADAARVPLIVVAEEGNVHLHAMIRQVAGYVVPTLQDALDIAMTIIGFDVRVAPQATPAAPVRPEFKPEDITYVE